MRSIQWKSYAVDAAHSKVLEFHGVQVVTEDSCLCTIPDAIAVIQVIAVALLIIEDELDKETENFDFGPRNG